MNTKLKITALVTAIVFALAGCNEKQNSNNAATNQTTNTNAWATIPAVKLETDKQKTEYAIGASFAEVLKQSLNNNNEDNFEANTIMHGFLETFMDKGQLSTEQINQVLTAYDNQKTAEREAFLKQAAERNLAEGKKYADEFAKQAGVKKSESGLLVKIDNPGTGKAPSEYDAVKINYVGKLITGEEFGSSYKDGKPLIMKLDEVIDGWREGIMQLKEGGKATLVIPPDLAFADTVVPKRREFAEILPQSTLVIDVELLEVNPEIVDDDEAVIDSVPEVTTEAATEQNTVQSAPVDNATTPAPTTETEQKTENK